MLWITHQPTCRNFLYHEPKSHLSACLCVFEDPAKSALFPASLKVLEFTRKLTTTCCSLSLFLVFLSSGGFAYFSMPLPRSYLFYLRLGTLVKGLIVVYVLFFVLFISRGLFLGLKCLVARRRCPRERGRERGWRKQGNGGERLFAL